MSIRAKKSDAVRFLEKITGGPLTIARSMVSIRLCEELTQAEFARKLGISRSHLNDIEKGRKGVTPVRALQFSKKLGMPSILFIRLALQDQLERAGLKYIVNIEAA